MHRLSRQGKVCFEEKSGNGEKSSYVFCLRGSERRSGNHSSVSLGRKVQKSEPDAPQLTALHSLTAQTEGLAVSSLRREGIFRTNSSQDFSFLNALSAFTHSRRITGHFG